MIKVWSLDTCYSATYLSQTRDQQRFTLSEVTADWHERMVEVNGKSKIEDLLNLCHTVIPRKKVFDSLQHKLSFLTRFLFNKVHFTFLKIPPVTYCNISSFILHFCLYTLYSTTSCCNNLCNFKHLLIESQLFINESIEM